MLRRACGSKLANDGHDTRAIQACLGHRNIQNMPLLTFGGSIALRLRVMLDRETRKDRTLYD
jgi:site-specific recombinase XerD